MTRYQQRAMLKAICDNIRDDLLKKADQWPEDWDGHELRELVALVHQHERTVLMREPYSRRRRDCHHAIRVQGLHR